MHYAFTKPAAGTARSTHIALQLPEIVDLILSYLVTPHRHDDLVCKKAYRHLYECLFVNRLWHGCAARILWHTLIFEDSKAEYETFIKFASLISDSPVVMTSSSSSLPSAATLAIAAASIRASLSDRRDDPLKPQLQPNRRRRCHRHQQTSLSVTYPLPKFLSNSFNTMEHDCNEDPLFIPSLDKILVRTENIERSNLGLYRGAIRSLTLREIKDKTDRRIPPTGWTPCPPNSERLDIYICDYVTNAAIYPFLAHAKLAHLSLAGCHRISDEAILQIGGVLRAA